MKLTYVGPHDVVDLDAPAHGFHAQVARGSTVSVPDSLAEQLLEQPTNWVEAPAPEPKHDAPKPSKAAARKDV